MEILPARGRRRRDGKRAAADAPFPWEQQAAEADDAVEGDDAHDADDDAYQRRAGGRVDDEDVDDELGGSPYPGRGGEDAQYGDTRYGEAQYGAQYEDTRYQDGQYEGGQYEGAQYEGAQYVDSGYGDAAPDDAASTDDDDPAWAAQGGSGYDWSEHGSEHGSEQAAGADDWSTQQWQADQAWADEDLDDEDLDDQDLDDQDLDDQDPDDQDLDGQDAGEPTAAAAGRSTRRARRVQEPAPRRRPSAGRNLPAAIGVGVALAGLVVASLFVRKEAFVAVVAVAVGLAVWELTQAFAERRINVPLVPLLVGSLGIVVSGFASGEEAMLVAFALTSLAVLLWRVIDDMDGAVRDVAAGIFTAAYVPFLAGFAMLMLAADDGPRRIVVFVLVTVASDIGGYAVGVVAGRHPMAPSVSPKKSWEGLGGSALFCLVAGIASVTLLLDGPWWAGALVGLATVVTATVGDLSESLLKRDLGIKDMGSLLPGHGGMMDRLDSLLPTAPAAYLLLAVLVPVA